jgi:hypothetical protein
LLAWGRLAFMYQSGEEVLAGDRILYAESTGEVEFVVVAATGDPAMDWYLEISPGGGFMIKTGAMGSVFLSEADEDLEFVSRAFVAPG